MIEQLLEYDVDPTVYPVTWQLLEWITTSLTDDTQTEAQRIEGLITNVAHAVLHLEDRLVALIAAVQTPTAESPRFAPKPGAPQTMALRAAVRWPAAPAE